MHSATRFTRPSEGSVSAASAAALRFRLSGAAFRVFLLLFCVFFCLDRPAGAQQERERRLDVVRLQLKWRHQFQFAGYYAAIAKGFYEREGLKVQLIEGYPGVVPTEEVLAERADFGVDSASILLHYSEGKPVVALAAVFQHSATVVLTRKDSGLFTPQDLVGKRVMFTTPTDPECLAMQINEGIGQGSYTLVPHSWNVDDLIEGRVDAMTAYLTNEPNLMERKGVTPAVILPRNYAVDFYGDCLVTSRREVREHPERVEAFTRASLEGWRYAMENPEEIADLILAKYPTAKDRESLLYEARTMRHLVMPDMVELGHMNPDRWRHIAKVYGSLGMIAPDIDISEFLYSEIRQAQEAQGRRIASTVFAVSAALAVLAALLIAALLVFNKRLKRSVEARTLELRASRDFFRKILDTIPDPVFVKDSQHRFVLVNAAMAGLVGWKPEEMAGKSDPDFFPDEQVAVFWERDDLVLATGRENVSREVVTGREGQERIISTKKTMYQDASGERLVVGVIRDMTDFTRMQDLVAQAEKMTSLGNLAAGMAHEINNPLGIILQTVQNLERRLFGSLEANRREAAGLALDLDAMGEYLRRRGVLDSVRDIREAGERAAGIVRNMLQFSRKSDPEQGPCDLREIVESMLDLVSKDYDIRRNYDFKKVAIVREYSPESFPVHCSASQVGQVVLNILLNAVHAMFCAGETREEPRLVISLRPEGKAMRLEIRDNGPGMDESVRRRIFEPFFTTKRTGEGTGLGMFVAYNIITNTHGGSLTVESSPGQGAAFVIVLPREMPDSPC